MAIPLLVRSMVARGKRSSSKRPPGRFFNLNDHLESPLLNIDPVGFAKNQLTLNLMQI